VIPVPAPESWQPATTSRQSDGGETEPVARDETPTESWLDASAKDVRSGRAISPPT
jgi:hypothetical protein